MAAATTGPVAPTVPAPHEPLQSGESVMLIGGDVHRLVTLGYSLRQKLGKIANVSIGSLIGQPAGIMYEVDEARRVLIPYTGPTAQDAEEVGVAEDAGGADNRHLLDSSDSQNLTQEQIEALKAEAGVKGIVDELVKSSATFQQKTAFAQQKYIRRKKKKYVATFLVERLNVDTMSELWCPTRRNECFPDIDTRWVRLRVDAMAQLMCLGNVHAASRVMVAERTNGFLPSALFTRLGPDGQIYHVLKPQMHATMTNAKNLGVDDVKRRWKCVRREALLDPSVPQHPAEKQDRAPYPGDEAGSPTTAAGDAAGAAEGASTARRPLGPSQWYDGNEARELFATAPPDSLVVADDSPDLPQDVVELLPYIAGGATIAVYCPYLEPLAELFRRLMAEQCVCIQLRDTWYREYQVLPGRTHPFVNMTQNGGYLLSAIKAQPRLTGEQLTAAATAQAEARLKKHRPESA